MSGQREITGEESGGVCERERERERERSSSGERGGVGVRRKGIKMKMKSSIVSKNNCLLCLGTMY